MLLRVIFNFQCDQFIDQHSECLIWNKLVIDQLLGQIVTLKLWFVMQGQFDLQK